MAWDNNKSTAADPDNPQADEQLTADEWDNHVSEGHFPSDELNFGVDGNGDPVITDPQNGGQTVMRYDRSAGSWVVDALQASTGTVNGNDLIGVPDNSVTGSASFGGGWVAESSTRPVLLTCRFFAETDGTNDGSIILQIDESGGTTPDYELFCFVNASQGAGSQESESFTFVLPPGGQYQIINDSDPNGENTLNIARSWVL